MKNQLRVLIVEDSHSDTLLLLRELRQAGYEVEHRRVDNAPDMQNALVHDAWDIILSDFSMPDFSATAALELVQEQALDIPFIIVSGTMGEEAAVVAMKAGAHDYFSKGRTARLGVAIDREIQDAAERRRRQEIEKQLYQAEKRFTQAFQINPSAICISTLQEDVIWEINPRFLELFAYKREEVIGKTTAELDLWVNPLERRAQLVHLQQEESIRDVEMQVRSQKGTIHQVLVSCESMVLGSDLCSMTFMHDLTERKQAEDELQALYNATAVLFKADTLVSLGQQVVQAVVDEFRQFDCGLIMIDPNQKYLIRLARSGELKVETYTPLSVDGSGLVPEAIRTGSLIYAPDVRLDDRYVANEPRTKSELVIPLQTAKGIVGVLDFQSDQINAFSERDQRILTTFAERAAVAIELMILYEEINRYAGELEDRVIQRTQELEHAKKWVETILNNSSDAIALADATGMIQQTNPAFETLFGHSSYSLFHQPLTKICADQSQADALKNRIEQVVETKQPQRLELKARHQNQTYLDVDLALAPVTHNVTQDTHVICSFRDISERKQLEANLRLTLERERELNELKSRFTSMVSHEFRTPLTIIQVSTDTLSAYMERLSEERKQYHLNNIQNQIKRLTGMMEDILIISKTQSVGMQFTPVRMNLETLCREVVAEIQSGARDHIIQFIVTGGCPDVSMDTKLLHRMLANLLSNAIKYSPENKDITCILQCVAHQVVLTVKDNGIGIPETDIEHLFDDFHRAENVGAIPGTGLGLSIVKQAVEAHGGTIQVESALGQGTTFTVTFPTSHNSSKIE